MRKKYSSYRIVGYYPDWKPDKLDRIDFGKITNLIYAFAIPDGKGGLLPIDHGDTAKEVIRRAHENQVTISIAVGGWEYKDVELAEAFVSSTDTPEKMDAFVKSIVELVDSYGFDGVDIDWEHPHMEDKSHVQYENLMVQLRAALPGKCILTSAVVSGVTCDGEPMSDGLVHSAKVIEAVDWLNVMAYDGGDGEKHSSYDFAVQCAEFYLKHGVPGEKISLGVPFYGRPTWATYEELCERDERAYEKDILSVDGTEVYYNGMDTIRKKTLWALEHVGGVMIWEIAQDSPVEKASLLNCIYETVMN